MKLNTSLACLLLAGIATAAPAQTASASMISVPGQVRVKNQIHINATVTAIDAASRTVTVKTAKGKSESILAGPEVSNFDQIKVGDAVHGLAVETLTLELLKGGAGKPMRQDGEGGAKAAPGAKPSGALSKRVVIIADVVAVDRKAGTVRVKGPKQSMTLDVADPEQLKLIEVGDAIRGTYEAEVAVALAAGPA